MQTRFDPAISRPLGLCSGCGLPVPLVGGIVGKYDALCLGCLAREEARDPAEMQAMKRCHPADARRDPEPCSVCGEPEEATCKLCDASLCGTHGTVVFEVGTLCPACKTEEEQYCHVMLPARWSEWDGGTPPEECGRAAPCSRHSSREGD